MSTCYIARRRRSFFALTSAAITASLPLLAQQRALTAADYARAERFMSYPVDRAATARIYLLQSHMSPL